MSIKVAACGNVDAGKCLGEDTPVMMYNGRIKMVQDVEVNDILMGDDSKPRIVIGTTSGHSMLYQVNQCKQGDNYIVNDAHILSLKIVTDHLESILWNGQRYCVRWIEKSEDGLLRFGHKKFPIQDNLSKTDVHNLATKFLKEKVPNIGGYLAPGSVIDLNIQDYLKLSDEIKNFLRGFHVGVEYETQKVTVDPYIYGSWLGGSSYLSINVQSMDDISLYQARSYLKSSGSQINPDNNIQIDQSFLIIHDLINRKRIIPNYLYNDRATRLQLLAGIIDAIGHYQQTDYLHRFIIELASEKLTDDIIRLCRSLGFSSYKKVCSQRCKNYGTKICFNFSIRGNIEEIPTMLTGKQAQPKPSKWDISTHLIEITPDGEGKYYGFEVTGNGRFLLGDFTVTHNSTTISCLRYDELDDGKGSARQKVFIHAHEKETGRTSSISKVHIPVNGGNMLSFVDLAGHEKYFRTTISGVTTHMLDYAMILVGGNMGVTKMTKEHMSLVFSLKIPIFIVVTKMDICQDRANVLEETMNDIYKLLRKTKKYKLPVIIENADQVNECIDLYQQKIFYDACPIFQISNKTGYNLDLLKHFISNLPIQRPYIDVGNQYKTKLFRVHEKFTVKGVGNVVSGCVMEGKIKKGDHLFMGPVGGQWVRLTIRSLHDDYRNEVQELLQNQCGCIAFNLSDKKLKLPRSKMRRAGVMMADQPYVLSRNFKAQIAVTTGHSTTIGVNYQPVLNCKSISQAAKVCELDKKVIRCGDVATARMHFMFRPEYINPGDIFVFREGNLRGIGKISELLPDNMPMPPNPKSMSRRERRRQRLQELKERERNEA